MIEFLKSLVPRHYVENEIIFQELQEISEITFVEKGSYYVGYEINKVKKMKLHFPPGNIIGGVNCVFLKKSWHIYKCKFEIHGYAVSRENWMKIEEDYKFMINEVNKKMFISYNKEIRTPLYRQKMQDLEILKNRADLTNIVTIDDLKDDEI